MSQSQKPSPAAVSSALPASQAWANKKIKLVLLGRKHRNGARFTETYIMNIVNITDPVSVADVIREALEAAQGTAEIPADLLEGVEFRFVAKD